MSEDNLFRLLVSVAREAVLLPNQPEPKEGDLVVEVSKFGLTDPDAIGWLLGHGEAAYAEDNTGPSREVWDIVPLRGLLTDQSRARGFVRWENAEFRVVPASLDVLEAMRGSACASS